MTAPNPSAAALAPADRRASAAPFVAQLADRARAVLAPQPASGTCGRGQRLLPDDDAIAVNRHESRNRSPMPGNNRRLTFFCGFEQIRKLIARFFRAFA